MTVKTKEDRTMPLWIAMGLVVGSVAAISTYLATKDQPDTRQMPFTPIGDITYAQPPQETNSFPSDLDDATGPSAANRIGLNNQSLIERWSLEIEETLVRLEEAERLRWIREDVIPEIDRIERQFTSQPVGPGWVQQLEAVQRVRQRWQKQLNEAPL